MRIIIFLLLLFSVSKSALTQITPADKTVKPPAKTEMPSKTEIQSQMTEATNEIKKEIADIEKQIASSTDPDEIKGLKEQSAMLKKQLSMMEGLNRNMAGMSDKVYKEAANQESAPAAPKRDATRISMIPKKTLSDAELLLFLRNTTSGVEKLIPAAERTEALNIYNQTKAQYKSVAIVANAANGCWMIGHWEKALFIMGKACMDDITDADNLNNYAAFLVMTGGEQAAIPILQYLDQKYPGNSTILNNLGQAWFGLGEVEKAKKYLDTATILYPNHSTANSTLSGIAVANHDPQKAISYLKASLKENYDPEKEAELRKLGYEIKFADMPPLNYPMKNDPLGLIPLITSWNPDKIQSSISDGGTAFSMQRYLNGIENFKNELNQENADLTKSLEQRGKKISLDSAYRQDFLEPYNCPAYLLAGRSLQLYCFEKAGVCFKPSQFSPPFFTALWMPLQKPKPDLDEMLSVTQIIRDCDNLWFQEVLKPVEVLAREMPANAGYNCADYDAKMDAYLAKRKEIYSRGVKLIQNEFIKNSHQLTTYIKYKLYSTLDEPPHNMDDLSEALISDVEARIGRRRVRNADYDEILSLIEQAKTYEGRYKSNCGDPIPDPSQPGDDLARLKVTTLECEYIKHVITPVRYEFKLECNIIKEKTDPKLKKRKPNVSKGDANIARRRNASGGPVQHPRGPNSSFFENEQAEANAVKAPLNSEDKDISQFSLEYNKWGNLVGINFQLNEDGSTLKDPDSIESDVDSRWSWNAIASGKKGYLNKLLIK